MDYLIKVSLFYIVMSIEHMQELLYWMCVYLMVLCVYLQIVCGAFQDKDILCSRD